MFVFESKRKDKIKSLSFRPLATFITSNYDVIGHSYPFIAKRYSSISCIKDKSIATCANVTRWKFKTDVSKETLRVGVQFNDYFWNLLCFSMATISKCLFLNWLKFTFVGRKLLKNTNAGITSEWTAWANRNHGKSWSIVQENKKW